MMIKDIRESDRKKYRQLYQDALQAHCQATLHHLAALTSEQNENAHERYLEVFDYVHSRDKEVARLFDGLRRSTAKGNLICLWREGLVSDAALADFSEDIHELIDRLREVPDQ